jgi:hypothetical protein
MTRHVRFGYVDGRKFFDGVAALGRKTYVEDIFRKPPATKDLVLHPERYYDAKAGPAARDVDPILDALAKVREEWGGQRPKFGELELRASFGDFVDRKEVDAVAPRLLGGKTLVLTPKDSPGSKIVAFLVLQTDGPETASKLTGLFAKLSRAKEERMKEGAMRIVKAERAALKTKSGAPNERTRSTVEVRGQTIMVVDVIARLGEYVIEVLYSVEEATDDELVEHVDRIVEMLKEKK